MSIKMIYKNLRKKGWKAKEAMQRARIVDEFNSRDDVRLRVIPMTYYDIKDLKGDCYNPKANPDISPKILKDQEREFELTVATEGVNGIVGQYKGLLSDHWHDVDSIWGFVGDSWKESGYDEEIMKATMEKADLINTPQNA